MYLGGQEACFEVAGRNNLGIQLAVDCREQSDLWRHKRRYKVHWNSDVTLVKAFGKRVCFRFELLTFREPDASLLARTCSRADTHTHTLARSPVHRGRMCP